MQIMFTLAHMTHEEVPVLAIVFIAGAVLGAGYLLAKLLGRKK